MKIFILLSLIAATFAYPKCPENQYYDVCGSDCPLTCDNFNTPEEECDRMCNRGCHCEEGYLKTDRNRCVKPEDCPSHK
ncbi:von Willebrand factor, partial [Stegodyphus mimosarum]